MSATIPIRRPIGRAHRPFVIAELPADRGTPLAWELIP
jgi:hypothetical protein